MLHVGMDGWMGWDWMVIIGLRSSKSTFGANKANAPWKSHPPPGTTRPQKERK